MRIPLTPNLGINLFSGGTITQLESGTVNGVIENNESGPYLTQRPAINVSEDASATVSAAKGRGIYYWDGNTDVYFVNNATVYKTSYATVIGTITAGIEKCYFFSIGARLVLLDPANDRGWTITTGGTLAEITDTDFPPRQTPAVALAYGGADVDGYLFALGENGSIYQSALEDATAWAALDYLTAERNPDGGVSLNKHHDNIVVFGPRTTEIFYVTDAATGSVLARRQDVFYNTGCASGASVHEQGDDIFFAGADTFGAIGVYVMSNFVITKISTATIDSFLSQAVVKDGYMLVGSGFGGMGHEYYLLSIYPASTTVAPETTLCFDSATKQWSRWETSLNSMTQFPVMATSSRTGISTRYGQGIFNNGDLFTLNDSLIPIDTLLSAGWVESGWVESGWVSETPESGTNISLTCRTGQYDGGTAKEKFHHSLRLVSQLTSAAQTLTIKHSNDSSRSFNAGRTIDMSKNQKLTALGKFRRRNFQVEYAGSEQVRLHALEGDMTTGPS